MKAVGGGTVGGDPVTLSSNDFQLFGVPVRFAQDAVSIDARWKELQREAHPDKFASSDAASQRLALQWSVRINEAYRRLKNPLQRAAYLCELAGVPVNAENNTAMPADFLMQQMEWREQLDAAEDARTVEALHRQVAGSRDQMLQCCEELLDQRHDTIEAVAQVRALMFIERFNSDIERRLERLETDLPLAQTGTRSRAADAASSG